MTITWDQILRNTGGKDLDAAIHDHDNCGLYTIEINGEGLVKDATRTELMLAVIFITKVLGKKDMKQLVKMGSKLPDPKEDASD